MNWWENLKSKIILNEPLRDKTTFRIGGAAKFYCEPKDAEELKLLIIYAKRYNIPIFVIGSGSNVLVSDKGINGLVLKLNSAFFKKSLIRRNYLEAGSGFALGKLVQAAAMNGLSGLEFLAGIPGTVGGALAMNAGAWGKGIGDCVQEIRVMDYNGNIKTLRRKDIRFGYRSSNLEKYIILGCVLRLKKEKKGTIENTIKECLGYRRNTQDASSPNAGCVFKNPTGISAGRLIDLCGLKGRSFGGASISLRHANFIMNTKNAKALDVLKLMGLARDKVKRKFDIALEPEIKIWR